MKTRAIKDSDTIVIDYETTGLVQDPSARVFSYSLTWIDDGYDGYTEVYRLDVPKKIPLSLYEDRIQDFWSSPCSGVAHNFAFENHMTLREGWKQNSQKQMHDTMIMHQYINNLSSSNQLKYLASLYAGIVREWEGPWKVVKKAFKIYGRYDLIPEELMHPYQVADGEATASLYSLFLPLVKPWDEYLNEIKLIYTTVRMERLGFMVARDKAQSLLAPMQDEIASNEIEIEAIAGRKLNMNSPAQLSRFLYNELGLPNQGSVNNDALENLRKISDLPILDCILKARAYTRGISTVQSYLDLSEHNGAIHPSINTNKARTGRETSENPNMQNVSKEVKAGAKYTVAARRCFRARPGYFLLLADYAGIEMRLGVQGTKSERLIKLCHSDFDFHDACATSFYGKRYTEEKNPKIKKALRGRAKNARFAMFYGAGIKQTADTLGLSIEEVTIGYEHDRKDFPEIYSFMDECTAFAKTNGYIETFFGRKLRTEADRAYVATDYKIQGSAAALFKHAQVDVDKYFINTFGDNLARCILPVHDELVMELHRSLLPQLDSMMVTINKTMTDYPQITVPIKIEFNISMLTWDAKKEITYGFKK
jgi:DNA polymerase I-like protein with 3'-5' exonuclease and polymerase domains